MVRKYAVKSQVPVPAIVEEHRRVPRIVWLLMLWAVIIAALLWYQTEHAKESQRLAMEETIKQKSPEHMTEQILSRTYVIGLVKEVSAEGMRVGITAPTDIELFAVITPTTKFYEEDPQDPSKKTEIPLNTIPNGSFVKVVAAERIGTSERIDALEIIKLQ